MWLPVFSCFGYNSRKGGAILTPTNPAAPAFDPTAATPPSNPTVDLLTEPTVEECIKEWNRYYEDRKAGRISVRVAPKGPPIVYFGGRIIDHDANYLALCSHGTVAVGVHPARLVIDYPWMW